ncbi:response regulator transcription factor [Ostreiculturibacter nitratireducens]|uniref:response regulator transcription factor n=1 Tax=Ostreiculturibacter nitratireducens TaxID=3075226 RepID=UPI0031B62538
MKVLLVEDDHFHAGYLREAVAKALPEANEVILASNGLEGEIAARRDGIGAIVMDLQMKTRNGIDAARTIWAERPETRILFWSNYSDEAYLRGISRIVPKESAYGYVLKTASNERLHLALRSVLIEGQIVVDREVHQVQQRQARPAEALTDSEYAVLMDMSLGLPDKAIARRQGMSLRTVQNRLLSLYDKLGVPASDEDGDFQMNKRARAIALALISRTVNAESLEIAERELQGWIRRALRESGPFGNDRA